MTEGLLSHERVRASRDADPAWWAKWDAWHAQPMDKQGLRDPETQDAYEQLNREYDEHMAVHGQAPRKDWG
jgi:hypothetical protein